MLSWIQKRRQQRIENSGGFKEKKKAISMTNEVAADVIKRMRSLFVDRRKEQVEFFGPDRRVPTL